MRVPHSVLAAMLLITIACPPASACSCPPTRESNLGVVQEALNDATWVFLAKVRDVRQYDFKQLGPLENPDPHWISVTEDVRFVVLEVFKGELFVGQPVMIRNEYAPGSCAMTARNDPMWIEEIVAPDVGMPARISDTWLIYSRSAEPVELNSCTRTVPVDFAEAKQDLGYLRELQKKVRWIPPRR
jgi:hypothetical protein